MDVALNEKLKKEWTDQYVVVDESRLELLRWKGTVGRVVTVNWNNLCLIDFADGAWYDIAPAFLKKIDAEEGKKKYDPKANSAQPIPSKQG
jgi:hypothetical protein